MPVLIAIGARSPAIMVKIASVLSCLVSRGSLVKLESANHALATTRADAVAALIADLADTCAHPRAPGDARWDQAGASCRRPGS